MTVAGAEHPSDDVIDGFDTHAAVIERGRDVVGEPPEVACALPPSVREVYQAST